MDQIWPKGTFTLFHNNIFFYQKNCPISIFKFSIKNDFWTLTLAPPKNHVNIFKNQKLNATTQTPIQYTTFLQYTSFTKYLYFLRYKAISTSTPHIFCPSKFELFDLRNPKIWIWQIPSSHIIPNLKWTKRAQKIPNRSSSWLDVTGHDRTGHLAWDAMKKNIGWRRLHLRHCIQPKSLFSSFHRGGCDRTWQDVTGRDGTWCLAWDAIFL